MSSFRPKTSIPCSHKLDWVNKMKVTNVDKLGHAGLPSQEWHYTRNNTCNFKCVSLVCIGNHTVSFSLESICKSEFLKNLTLHKECKHENIRVEEVPQDHICFSLQRRISRVIRSVQPVRVPCFPKLCSFLSCTMSSTQSTKMTYFCWCWYFLHHFTVLLLYRQHPE